MIVSKLKIYKRGRRRDLHKPNKPTKKKERKGKNQYDLQKRKKERRKEFERKETET